MASFQRVASITPAPSQFYVDQGSQTFIINAQNYETIFYAQKITVDIVDSSSNSLILICSSGTRVGYTITFSTPVFIDNLNAAPDACVLHINVLAEDAIIEQAQTQQSLQNLALNDLVDVVFAGAPVLNEGLIYNGTNWANATIPSGSTTLATLTDVQLTGLSNNDWFKYNGGTTKWENIHNSRLSITVTYPSTFPASNPNIIVIAGANTYQSLVGVQNFTFVGTTNDFTQTSATAVSFSYTGTQTLIFEGVLVVSYVGEGVSDVYFRFNKNATGLNDSQSMSTTDAGLRNNQTTLLQQTSLSTGDTISVDVKTNNAANIRIYTLSLILTSK